MAPSLVILLSAPLDSTEDTPQSKLAAEEFGGSEAPFVRTRLRGRKAADDQARKRNLPLADPNRPTDGASPDPCALGESIQRIQ